jgi:hypothetical protein
MLSKRARNIIVDWGTMLQAGRSRIKFSMRLLDDFSIDPMLPTAPRPWVSIRLQQKWIPRTFLGGEARPARKVDNLTAISEPTVQKLCEPRRFTTLWASTASYRDSYNSLHKSNPSSPIRHPNDVMKSGNSSPNAYDMYIAMAFALQAVPES